MTTQPWAVAGVFLAAFLAALGSLFFKKGSGRLSLNPIALLRNLKLMAGFAFYGMSSIIFVLSIRGGELSVLYPIAASSYIWVCLLSIKFLGERLNKSKFAGILLIVAGVGFIGLGA